MQKIRKIELVKPVHFVFPLDPVMTGGLLRSLLRRPDVGTVFVFLDRALGKDLSNSSPYLEELQLELSPESQRLFFIKGDSRYANLGARPSTWSKFLPHFHTIWMLPPFHPFILTGVHLGFAALYKKHFGLFAHPDNLHCLEILPEIMPGHAFLVGRKKKKSLEAAVQEWHDFAGRSSLQIGWPDSLLEFMYRSRISAKGKITSTPWQRIIDFWSKQSGSDMPLLSGITTTQWASKPRRLRRKEVYFRKLDAIIRHRLRRRRTSP